MLGGGVAFIENRFVPIDDAKISVLDWGLLHSDATYDVVHVWKGAFFRLDDHIDRFFRSAAALRLNAGMDRAQLMAILTECVRKSGLRDAYVEMVVTRGQPRPGSRDPRLCDNRFFAFAIPFVWLLPRERWQQGLSAALGRNRRIPSAAVDARIKNYHWLDFTLGLFHAFEQGAETVILLDENDHVAEGPGFNIFAVSGGRVVTPSANVLEGITRRTVFELCEHEQIACRADAISSHELANADEIFISSTAGGLMPITQLNGRAIGKGVPGPVTSRLDGRYWTRKEQGWHGTPIRYDQA
jgi:branched-chain amino acid aminotransferase